MDLPQLTNDQAIVLSVITGCVLIPMRYVLEDISKRLDRQVTAAEFGDPEFIEELQELYRPDFLKLVVMQPTRIILPNG